VSVRKLMVAAMMVMVLLLLYEAAWGGEAGIGRSLENRAQRAGTDIGLIDP